MKDVKEICTEICGGYVSDMLRNLCNGGAVQGGEKSLENCKLCMAWFYIIVHTSLR